MCKVLEHTISSYVTYSRVLWILYVIHRGDWQVNKAARDRDSDYCGNAVFGSDLGDPEMQFYRKRVSLLHPPLEWAVTVLRVGLWWCGTSNR